LLRLSDGRFSRTVNIKVVIERVDFVEEVRRIIVVISRTVFAKEIERRTVR